MDKREDIARSAKQARYWARQLIQQIDNVEYWLDYMEPEHEARTRLDEAYVNLGRIQARLDWIRQDMP